MKIHQLPLGARFEYEGEEYVKTGPLFGSGPGGQRLIPKYALLKVSGENNGPVRAIKGDTLDKNRLVEALEVFYADCLRLVPENRRGELAAAKARFLKSINI